MKKSLVATIAGVVFSIPLACSAESVEEKIEALQKQVDELKAQASEDRRRQPASEMDTGTAYQFESAAKKAELQRTAIGGYGEINYNNYRKGDRRDVADLKRFILFFGHRFNERLRLYSELEVEHAFVEGGDPDSGEVAMEQAYIQYALVDGINLRAGLMLLPTGFLNEYHEPPIFYGVERNDVETRIIPTTWRELGVALQGNVLNGLEYNAGIATTPDASRFENASSGIRQMRGKGNRVTANEFGWFAGVNYRGIPGLQVGASVFTGNTGQDGQGTGSGALLLTGVDARLTLWELHARYTIAGFDLRALYADGTLDDTAAINAAAGVGPGSGSAAPESFYGWFAEAAYHLYRKGDLDIAPFLRYERYNTQESVAAGFSTNPENNEKLTTVGVNLWVHPQVVFKADFQDYRTDDTKDRFNLGVGYMF